MHEAMDRLSRSFHPAAGDAVALLAMVGLIKAKPVREALPIDATLLVLGFCVALCICVVAARRPAQDEAGRRVNRR